jgi:hypothetical protein
MEIENSGLTAEIGGSDFMNYAEILAYWYLRLNGFIPLNNLVVHRDEHGFIKHSADIDLIAIRFPYVFEEVGGRPDDWDYEGLFNYINGNSIHLTNICIVEVKSGKCSHDDIENSFSEERLLYAINRVGILTQKQNSDIVSKQLQSHKYFTFYDDIIFYKLAITKNEVPGIWINLTLDKIQAFIYNRMQKYKGDKEPSRMFFPEPLIQYIAWTSMP